MKLFLPVYLCILILVGFFAACVSVFLSPSDNYISDQIFPAESTTTSAAASTQVYAILITDITTTSEAVPELSTTQALSEEVS